MPHAFDFREADGELVIRVEGAVTFEAVDAYMEELRVDPRMVGVHRVLIDLRGITRVEVRGEEIARLAQRQRERTREAQRVALLVTGELEFGLARQFGAFAETPGAPERRVFEDEAQAWAWLRDQSQGSE